MAEHVAGECGAVLIRGVNWIGDAVMTIPALEGTEKISARGKTVAPGEALGVTIVRKRPGH